MADGLRTPEYANRKSGAQEEAVGGAGDRLGQRGGTVDRELRDRRIIVAVLVWGADRERSADRLARSLTPGLNARDVLLLASLAFDRDGRALPNELIGPVHTTAAGVSGSLRRLEDAALIERGVGADARPRPVTLTDAGSALIDEILAPWQSWFDASLERLDDDERAELYRLLVKGSGIWNELWPATHELADSGSDVGGGQR